MIFEVTAKNCGEKLLKDDRTLKAQESVVKYIGHESPQKTLKASS